MHPEVLDMKTAVVAPLGMSPPVVSAFVDGIGEPISDLVLITTNNPIVRAGARLLTTGLARRTRGSGFT